jgi:hypothetical protein
LPIREEREDYERFVSTIAYGGAMVKRNQAVSASIYASSMWRWVSIYHVAHTLAESLPARGQDKRRER